MNKTLIFLFVAALLLITADLSYAQGKQPKRKGKFDSRSARWRGDVKKFSKINKYVAFGVSANSLNYFGDLAPEVRAASTDLSFTRAGLGISASKKLGDRYSVRSSFMYGRLRGDDFKSADPFDDRHKFRYVRNNHFRNDIKELSVVGVIDVFNNTRSYHYRQPINPYFFGGIAVFHHNPKAIAPATDLQGNPLAEAGKWVNLKPLGTEGQYSAQYDVKPYSNFQIALPIGIGVKYKLNQNLDFSFEIGYRHLFFDYIDDTSRDYVNLDALNSDLARAMSFRGKEETAAYYKKPRNFSVIDQTTTDYSYTGPDGKVYNVFAGYGVEGRDHLRGNSKSNDIYIVTTFHVAYILPTHSSKSKYRR